MDAVSEPGSHQDPATNTMLAGDSLVTLSVASLLTTFMMKFRWERLLLTHVSEWNGKPWTTK